ncbi:MAG: hypothetical protein HLUCCA01_08035 [Bacteroidetes bacterium HLUCCA01]|nr:MAG: hypothetical protein HLUCCA01_08035 [Bacteroidetes bacterium HLUCCA01]
MSNTAVHHISEFFEHWAPFSTQAEYDNAGLLLGSQHQLITGILTCLDVTDAVVDEAISKNCNLIVAHHPVIFRKLARISPDTPQGALIYKLIQANIAVLAVHTNLDAAQNGVSFVLADLLGVRNPEILAPADASGTTGFGVIGQLDEPVTREDLLNRICSVLQTPAVRYADNFKDDQLSTVAVCGGSGVSLAREARKAGAQAYITADIKYHDYFDTGMVLVDAGHYETEVPIVAHMARQISRKFPDLVINPTETVTNPMQVHIAAKN